MVTPIEPFIDPNYEYDPYDTSWVSEMLQKQTDRGSWKYRALTLSELEELNIPEPEWLIEDLIPKGYTVLLSGPPKGGKGFVTVDMTASVAEGSCFLGKNVIQGPVIYASAEETIGEVKQRFFARVGDRRDHPIYILPLDGSLIDGSTDQHFKFENREHVDKLIELIEETGTVLIVLDVLRRLHDSKENEADSMHQIMDTVQRISRRTGVAIVLNHHTNKSGTSRGSNSIEGGVDVTMTLAPAGSNGRNLAADLIAKGRSVKEIALSISLGEDGRWQAHGQSSGDDAPKQTNADRILNVLANSEEPLTAPGLSERTGISLASLRTTITNIKKDHPGLLVEEKLEGKGSPIQYEIDHDLWDPIPA